MNAGISSGLCSVLSLDEEYILSLVREIIEGIRFSGRVADIGGVERALADAGVQGESVASAGNVRMLRMRSAIFFVQSRTEHAGAIELNFIEVKP
jgi:hypothetical protein